MPFGNSSRFDDANEIFFQRAKQAPKPASDQPPVSPTLVPALPEPIPPTSSSIATSEELGFFDRVKKTIGNKNTMNEFLKLCNLFSQDLIDRATLVHRARNFIGSNPDLFKWFQTWVGHGDQDDVIIENKARIPNGRIALSNCRGLGPSYRLLPKRVRARLSLSSVVATTPTTNFFILHLFIDSVLLSCVFLPCTHFFLCSFRFVRSFVSLVQVPLHLAGQNATSLRNAQGRWTASIALPGGAKKSPRWSRCQETRQETNSSRQVWKGHQSETHKGKGSKRDSCKGESYCRQSHQRKSHQAITSLRRVASARSSHCRANNQEFRNGS